LLARNEVKLGKDWGLEGPVWDRVTGLLLGAARWIGMKGARGGAEEVWSGVVGRWGSEGEAGGEAGGRVREYWRRISDN
jgi:hypothetical protein